MKTTTWTLDELDGLLDQVISRMDSKGESLAEAVESVTGGNRELDALLVHRAQGGVVVFATERDRQMAKTKLTVKTEIGTFTRTTDRTYTHLVVAKDVPQATAEFRRKYALKNAQENLAYVAEKFAQAPDGTDSQGNRWADELLRYRAQIVELQAPIAADVETEWNLQGWAGRLDLARKVAQTATTATAARRSVSKWVSPAAYVEARIYDVVTGERVR